MWRERREDIKIGLGGEEGGWTREIKGERGEKGK
jgi:hypothetical protein